jgi:Mg-chelatase subunit ChlI/Mg-chelatase subunit ChlD
VIAEERIRPIFPFTAFVGQEAFKITLLLNAIDPRIGGVLLTGPKGTGKSSIIRAVAEVFPGRQVVHDCRFNCDPINQVNLCDDCQTKLTNRSTMLPTKHAPVRVITLPLSASEDRVIGSVDVEIALLQGLKALHPGILAEANQNILYIDEVNLLPDHLVDMILDTSASGWNVIEREGISVSHPSHFVLIGSMNPEEGALRPQILDRFGLHAHAELICDPEQRIEVIKRREQFNMDPLAFREHYSAHQAALRVKVKAARDLLPRVRTPLSIIESVAQVCSQLQVDGYRPDIVLLKAARAFAAYHARTAIRPEDVRSVSNYVLSHRTRESGQRPPPSQKEIQQALRKTPIGKEILLNKLGALHRVARLLPLNKLRGLSSRILLVSLAALLTSVFIIGFTPQRIIEFFLEIFTSVDQAFKFFLVVTLALTILTLITRKPSKRLPTPVIDLARITAEEMSDRRGVHIVSKDAPDLIRTPSIADSAEDRTIDAASGEKVFNNIPQPDTGEELRRSKNVREGKILRGRSYLIGKRAPVVTSMSRGRYVWHELPKEKPWNIALGPTLRSAAPYQRTRQHENLSLVIKPSDIRVKMKEYRAPFSIVLLVDLSWSMVSSIINLGRAITTLHDRAFRRRDRVGLVVFKGNDAFVLQEPTTNVDLVVKKLWEAGASDFTPMATGMQKAWRLLRREKQRNKESILMLIVVSDGIANVALKTPVSIRTRKRYQSEAQADAMDIARLLAREEIKTIFINTSHSPLEASIDEISQKDAYTPTRFLMEVAQTAHGSYYGLELAAEEKIPLNSKKRKLSDWLAN